MRLPSPILVTGAAGFIGANLLGRLLRGPRNNIHIFVKKDTAMWRIKHLRSKIKIHLVDIADAASVLLAIKKVKPRTIFHLATYGGYSHQRDEKAVISANIIGTHNLMRACATEGFAAFVNTGSSSEYGLCSKPMRESDALKPNTLYGTTKVWATLFGQFLARTRKLPIVTMRPFSVYGPYEPLGRLMPNLIVAAYQGKNPHLSSPTSVRDYIYIEDLVDAYLAVANKPAAGEIFNVGTGKQRTLREVFTTMKKILHSPMEPIWDESVGRSFETKSWRADISKMKQYYRWSPHHDLESGLRSMTSWFANNKHLYQISK
ncbi:MAG: hypothetical protein A3B37_03610 [Candidatus Sungbacteria bacterium RIFCSPLOWO2_01_FULL_59_16]|uniref:NAD-dependent epimerase/dehydratase domain-containing protein n=1 Tax=Candidatus Sungbacteria bacterium RIFCSPLOWO2_01_FULL_59_16 TaxID=1802280 RepID=A0A1G2LBY5_9BACT|nr:MAG: hypothetical protein A3B37_03610 [Candidatus Sungbacteria bacterium RIFCSPLOWO2_01_FULL_59_16]